MWNSKWELKLIFCKSSGSMHGEVISSNLFNMHVNDNEIYFRILNVYHMKFYFLIVFSLINADNRESTEGLQIFLLN